MGNLIYDMLNCVPTFNITTFFRLHVPMVYVYVNITSPCSEVLRTCIRDKTNETD